MRRSPTYLPFALALVAGACHTGGRAAVEKEGRDRAANRREPDDLPVASVDGEPIFASEVASEARANGGSVRSALDRVVELHLVASKAERLGLDADPAVRAVGDREAVRALLKRRFEPSFTPADVPARDVRSAYEAAGDRYRHPELADVTYYVLAVPPRAPLAVEVRALAAAYAVRSRAAAADPPLDDRAFGALGASLSLRDAHVEGLVQSLATGREGYTQEAFARAAFAIAEPGGLAGPVRSSYGWHVLRLDERVPALDTPLTAVERDLREALFPAARRRAFARFYDEIAARHRVVVHADRLPDDPAGGISPSEPPP